MTLRLRLLLVLVGIVAVGLVVADAVTYNQLGSFLYQRTEQQLADSSQSVANTLSRCLAGQGPSAGAPEQCSQYFRFNVGTSVPVGTWAAVLDTNGGMVGEMFLGTTESASAVPTLQADLPGSNSGGSNSDYFSSSSIGSPHVHYEVLAQPVNGGGTFVVAFPTNDITATLRRLAWIEALVTLAVLGALGTLSWWIVRRGLRPLDDMADTALSIAEGDLTQRVADDGGQTEVGRLGMALNTMLGNIEAAFAARATSEERLRRFLADASHELRTPLTSIRGYAEMFDRGTRDRPEDLATSMFHIRAEADRMNELVNDLLLLARLDHERPLDIEQLDLGEVVDEAVGAAQVSQPARTITFTRAGAVPVEGDASRLRQVIDNLLANAERHTPAGTPVEVRLRAEGPSALLEVEDHGQGVAPEDGQRIFEPFHRADASRTRATGGMGLGLAIVAAITRAHGGSVGVRPGPSGGALFWVRVPLATPVQGAPYPPATEATDPGPGPSSPPSASSAPPPPPPPASRWPSPASVGTGPSSPGPPSRPDP